MSALKLRLLFADRGTFHHEDVEIPAEAAARHERLIDCIREDPDVLKTLHVDVDRLVAVVRTQHEPARR